MKAFLIAGMLVTFAASPSAAIPAKLLASNESRPAQFAYRECAYPPKERIAALALDAEPKCYDLRKRCQSGEGRSDLYVRIGHTLILGVAY